MSNVELNFESVDVCPLCASSGAVDVDHVDDKLMGEINRYLPPDILSLPVSLQNTRKKCVECGLVFLSPRLDDQSLSQVYSLWYGYAYRRVMDDPRHVEERLREFERHHYKLLERFCNTQGRLLDVGCGSGLFLQIAQNYGWDVSGVELDPDTADWARKKVGISQIYCGTLEESLLNGKSYDAITLFDYLEHTACPGKDLDILVNSLAPGGILMVRVPNAKSWQSQLMEANWLAVMVTHLSYFTPAVLQRALCERGLELLYMRAGNCRSETDIIKQRWFWLVKRLQAYWKKSAKCDLYLANDVNTPLNSGHTSSAIWKLVYSLWVEQIDHVGGWFGGGNNLTVIARKVSD